MADTQGGVRRRTLLITIGALSVALNMVLGILMGSLKISFVFLDTVGTIFSAVLFGPWWGALMGAIAGFASRKFGFGLLPATPASS